MSGFFSRLFGGKKNNETIDIIEDILDGVIEKSQLDLSFDVNNIKDNIYTVELHGEDEEMLKDKDGQLLDAFQLFMTRAMQNYLPETKTIVEFDCNGYREDSSRELVELAEKLKGIVVAKKKSVFFRALAPKDRKIIHQYLADDKRVKSKSIGDGLYKKIKIFPASQDRNKSGNKAKNKATAPTH